MHQPEIKRALDKVHSSSGEFELSVGDSQIEALGKTFEERVNEAKDMILNWN